MMRNALELSTAKTTIKFGENSRQKKITVEKCGKNCVCCQYLKEGIMNLHLKNAFIITSPFNCTSANLPYIINCKGCNEEYNGQTGWTLRERLVLYRQHIFKKPKYQTMYIEERLRMCGKSQKLISGGDAYSGLKSTIIMYMIT